MWALFIAIFGEVFWFCKLGHDRLQTKETDHRIAKLHAQYERWRNSVRATRLNAYTINMAKTNGGFLKLQEKAISVIRQLPGMENAKMQTNLASSSASSVICWHAESFRNRKAAPKKQSTHPGRLIFYVISSGAKRSREIRIFYCKRTDFPTRLRLGRNDKEISNCKVSKQAAALGNTP